MKKNIRLDSPSVCSLTRRKSSTERPITLHCYSSQHSDKIELHLVRLYRSSPLLAATDAGFLRYTETVGMRSRRGGIYENQLQDNAREWNIMNSPKRLAPTSSHTSSCARIQNKTFGMRIQKQSPKTSSNETTVTRQVRSHLAPGH